MTTATLERLVRGTHLPLVQVDLVAGSTTRTVAVKACTVSVSASQTGRRTGSVTVPFRPDVWDMVRDYALVTARVTAGYRLPNLVEQRSTLATLDVRRASVTRPADEILLELGDPCLRVAEQPFTADAALADATVSAFVRRMVAECALPQTLTVSLDAAMPAAQKVQAGDSRWQAVEDVCDITGLECCTARDGNLLLRGQPTFNANAAPVALLDVGPTGVVEESMSDYDREGFANGAVCVATWVDDANVPQRVEGWAFNDDPGDPARWNGPAGRKVWLEQRDGPMSTAQAQEVAASVLYRRAGAGRGVRLTTPALWWLEPGDHVRVELPTGPRDQEAVQLVQTVSWDLVAHTTTVETRTPRTTSIVSGPAGRI